MQNLNKENNFTIEISNIQKEQCRKGKIYWWKRISYLKLEPETYDEDITKWLDYNKIESLSKLINETKKNIYVSNLNLTMEVTLPNSISFERRPMFLSKKLEQFTYKYINTETKKIDPITFQNFQKLLFEKDMTQKDNKDELIYSVRRCPKHKSI